MSKSKQYAKRPRRSALARFKYTRTRAHMERNLGSGSDIGNMIREAIQSEMNKQLAVSKRGMRGAVTGGIGMMLDEGDGRNSLSLLSKISQGFSNDQQRKDAFGLSSRQVLSSLAGIMLKVTE